MLSCLGLRQGLRAQLLRPAARPASGRARLQPRAGHNRDPGVHDRWAGPPGSAGVGRRRACPPEARRLISPGQPLRTAPHTLPLPPAASPAPAPPPSPLRPPTRVNYNISVHGRHVDVTPELETLVKGRLTPVIDLFRSPAILESEGGVRDVDVRLMCVCVCVCGGGALGPRRNSACWKGQGRPCCSPSPGPRPLQH
jgi:hypothetical protein